MSVCTLEATLAVTSLGDGDYRASVSTTGVQGVRVIAFYLDGNLISNETSSTALFSVAEFATSSLEVAVADSECDLTLTATIENSSTEGRWEAGLFYERIPPKWLRDKTAAIHLRQYCSLLGRGLDTIEKSIDATKLYPLLQNQFYTEAFLEHLGYESLPDYFTPEDLRLFAPRLLECHRLKGTEVPLNVITEFVFRDAPSGFNYVVDEPDDNFNLFIRISMPVLDSSAVQDFAQYVGRKLRGLFYVLTRFVPFWLDLKILFEYLFIDIFPLFNDDLLDYALVYSVGSEAFPQPLFADSVSDVTSNYQIRQPFTTASGGSRPVLNNNDLNNFRLNSNPENVNLFSDAEDLEIELY